MPCVDNYESRVVNYESRVVKKILGVEIVLHS